MTRLCPYCKSPVKEKTPGIWPFCSERCKMSDLGAWMREDYRIAGRPHQAGDSDEFSDTSAGESPNGKSPIGDTD